MICMTRSAVLGLIAVFLLNYCNVDASVAGNCKMGINSINCMSDEDCGDYNGNQLVCVEPKNTPVGANNKVPNQCSCPSGIDCLKTPLTGVSAQYGFCDPNGVGCAGHGDKSNGGKESECQLPLICMKGVTQAGTGSIYLCHTCASCRNVNDTRIDCESYCASSANDPTLGSSNTAGHLGYSIILVISAISSSLMIYYN